MRGNSKPADHRVEPGAPHTPEAPHSNLPRTLMRQIDELISFEFTKRRHGYVPERVQEFHAKALSVVDRLIIERDAASALASAAAAAPSLADPDQILLAILDLGPTERARLIATLSAMSPARRTEQLELAEHR